MNALMIFNDIWHTDIYDHLRSYNDTVDPRRTWTLCGQLPEDQKVQLRQLIKDAYYWSDTSLEMFALMDGDTTIIPAFPKYSHYFASCYEVPNVYASTWINHNNQKYIDSLTRNGVPRTSHAEQQTDYVVMTEGMTSPSTGIPVFPSVGRIIHADIISGKTQKTIRWLQDTDYEQIIFTHAECIMMGATTDKKCMRMAYDVIFDACMNPSPENINTFTTEDVHDACLFNINPHVTVHDIWRVFGNGLIRCVDANMRDIIEMICASRHYYMIGLTLFVTRDVLDKCSDIDIITVT